MLEKTEGAINYEQSRVCHTDNIGHKTQNKKHKHRKQIGWGTHTSQKTTGDNTRARGMQAVQASYKTPTKCLNNELVTVSTMHETIITFFQFEKKKSNLLFHSRRKK